MRLVVAFCLALLANTCVTAEMVSAQDSKPLSETLSASEREEFIKDVSEGCLESQREAPENKGISESVINAYCRCTAEQMVARFSAAEVETIAESATPELQARVDQIEQACVPKAK